MKDGLIVLFIVIAACTAIAFSGGQRTREEINQCASRGGVLVSMYGIGTNTHICLDKGMVK